MPARPCELVHTSQKHSNDIVYHNPRVAFTGDQKIPPSSAEVARLPHNRELLQFTPERD